MKDYRIKFDIGDKVGITDLKCNGVVMSILIQPKGIRYEVRYFDKLELRSEYFFGFELSYNVHTSEIGFTKENSNEK